MCERALDVLIRIATQSVDNFTKIHKGNNDSRWPPLGCVFTAISIPLANVKYCACIVRLLLWQVIAFVPSGLRWSALQRRSIALVLPHSRTRRTTVRVCDGNSQVHRTCVLRMVDHGDNRRRRPRKRRTTTETTETRCTRASGATSHETKTSSQVQHPFHWHTPAEIVRTHEAEIAVVIVVVDIADAAQCSCRWYSAVLTKNALQMCGEPAVCVGMTRAIAITPICS